MRNMISDIEMEISALFLALKLSKQAELCRLNGDDEFELFRAFANIIKGYEKEREKENK